MNSPGVRPAPSEDMISWCAGFVPPLFDLKRCRHARLVDLITDEALRGYTSRVVENRDTMSGLHGSGDGINPEFVRPWSEVGAFTLMNAVCMSIATALIRPHRSGPSSSKNGRTPSRSRPRPTHSTHLQPVQVRRAQRRHRDPTSGGSNGNVGLRARLPADRRPGLPPHAALNARPRRGRVRSGEESKYALYLRVRGKATEDEMTNRGAVSAIR